jgi:hypothetical protein
MEIAINYFRFGLPGSSPDFSLIFPASMLSLHRLFLDRSGRSAASTAQPCLVGFNNMAGANPRPGLVAGQQTFLANWRSAT